MSSGGSFSRLKDRIKHRLQISFDPNSVFLPGVTGSSTQVTTNPNVSTPGHSSSQILAAPQSTAGIPSALLALSHPPPAPNSVSHPVTAGGIESQTASSSTPATSSVGTSSGGAVGSGPKQSAWRGLQTLLGVLQTRTDVFGPLSSVVGELNRCTNIYEQIAEGRDEYNELRTSIDSLLSDLGQQFSGAVAPVMTASINNLCSGIEKELAFVKEKEGRSRIRQFVKASQDVEQVLRCYQRIRTHLDRLTLNVNISMWKVVDEYAAETRLRQLSPTFSAVYNSAESTDIGRGPCMEGTREQELERLRIWTRNPTAGNVYWMNGMAGTGKTTIAYSLCADMDKSKELAASFFCSRQIPECRSVKLIIPAIAYQLSCFSRPFRYVLSQVLEADPGVHTRVLRTQFEELLVGPLLAVKASLPSDLVVVIDALDECEHENSIAQILSVLLDSSNLPVRFLLSSRPEPEIYRRMMARVGNDLNLRLVLHDLDKERVERDIRIFLGHELDGILSPTQVASLADRSGELFIYAATAARYIKAGAKSGEQEERLGVILESSDASPEISTGDIDALYSTILKGAFEKQELSQATTGRIKKLLDTVVCSQEPMTLDMLATIVQLKNQQQVDGLLRPLSSVLNISEASRRVTTLHTSFPDFLLDLERSTTFYCDAKSSHSRLAEACFRLIVTNVPQFNICALSSSSLRDAEVVDMTKRVDRAVSLSLFYACRFWFSHIELSNDSLNTSKMLYDFLSLYLLLWMEVLNVKNSMHLGSKIIRRAENWSNEREFSVEVAELAHDAWCFVTMFAGHAISQSTPHIYVSMLPFWPESSPIAKHYRKLVYPAVRTDGTALTRRHPALLATWYFDGPVRSARFSPDGRFIAMGLSSAVYIIDSATGQIIVGPLPHDKMVVTVALSHDGALVASGSDDNTVRVWRVQNGEQIIAPLRGHSKLVTSVCFSPDNTRIVSGSDDQTIRIWAVDGGYMIIGPLKGHSGRISSVDFSPDGSCVVTGSQDNTLRVWNAHNGEMMVGPLEGHTAGVKSVCFSPDGARIVSGAGDNMLLVWSTHSGGMIAGPLEGHVDPVNSVAFSHDGKHIVSGSNDRTIRLWSAEDPTSPSRALEGHVYLVNSVAFSLDGTRVVSSGWDHTVRVWDVHNQHTIDNSLHGHADNVTSVVFSPSGRRILSGSRDGTVRVWDPQTGQMLGNPLEGHTDEVNSVCVSPNGVHAASCSNDGTIRVWNLENQQNVIDPLNVAPLLVCSACFSPDGTCLVSGSFEEPVKLWDVKTGEMIGEPLEGHSNGILGVCFSPNGKRIVSGSLDNTLHVWDVLSHRSIFGPLEGHTAPISSVSWSPDGTRIVSGSWDGTLRVWDAESGQIALGPLVGHTGDVNTVRFSPNGLFIASCSSGTAIRLWDAQSGQLIGRPLVGHALAISSLDISPDSMRIVSGSVDLTIRVWDVSGMVGAGETEDLQPEISTISLQPFHPSWKLNEDGWLVDAQSQLLAWVPLDLHTALLRPRNPLLISTKGSFQLLLDHTQLGESWAKCLGAASRT